MVKFDIGETLTYIQDDLSGGLNNSSDPTKLDARFAIVMDNLYYDPVKRVIKKRNGYASWVTTAVDTNDRGKAIFRFYRTDEPDLLIAGVYNDVQQPPNGGDEGQVYYYDTVAADWQQITGDDRIASNGDYHFAQMNDMLIIANGETLNRACWFINDASDRMFQLGISKPPTNPTGPNSALPGGNLSVGTYKIKWTYMVDTSSYPFMEGYPSPQTIELACNTTNDAIRLQAIPTTVPSYQETHIGIYRTIANGSYYYLDKKLAIGATSTRLTQSDDDLQESTLLDSWQNYASPCAKFPAVHKDRLFLGRGTHKRWYRVNSQWIITGHNSRLYWSEAGMAHAWPLLNYLDFAPNDGEEIRGIHSFAGRMFVFKESKHYVMSFSDDPLNAYIEKYEPGLLAERSVASCSPNMNFPHGAMLWLARDKRIWLHDGTKAVPASWNIQSELDAITLDKLSYAAAVFYPVENWYIISVNEGVAEGSNDIAYVFDMNVGAWYKNDNFGFGGFTYLGGAGDNTELIGHSLNDTSAFDIYTLMTGTTDSSDAIVPTFESPLLAFGDSTVEKELRRVFVEGAFQNGAAVTCNIYKNRETSSDETFTITGVGGAGQIESVSVDVDPANYYRLKITQAVAGTFELFRYGFEYVKRRGFSSLESSSHVVGPGAVEE
jgi:hypothetical protein